MKPLCPRCKKPTLLEDPKVGPGPMSCTICEGLIVPMKILTQLVQGQHVQKVLENAKANSAKKINGKLACSFCKIAMTPVVQKNRVGTYELDVCLNCLHVWFDRDELKQAPRNAHSNDKEKEYSQLEDLMQHTYLEPGFHSDCDTPICTVGTNLSIIRMLLHIF